MTMINETIEPELKGAERQELSHLDYFRRKIEELRDRGLIAGNSFETWYCSPSPAQSAACWCRARMPGS